MSDVWILCSVNGDPRYFPTKRQALESLGVLSATRLCRGSYSIDVRHDDPETGAYEEQMVLYRSRELANKDGWHLPESAQPAADKGER